MAKESGLGDGLWVGTYDLSGDVGSLSRIASPRGVTDLTGINGYAFERKYTHKDGGIDFNTWYNPANAHLALRELPRTDVLVTYRHGSTIGNMAASMIGKQINYDGSRNMDGSFPLTVNAVANGFGLEWGEQLTAGVRTDSGATNGSSLDYGAGVGTTNFGLQAYLHVFAFTGTSATISIQSSTDNGAGDAFANVTGAVFTTVTAATFERIQTGRTAAVERYLRVATTGTFSNLQFAVVVVRNSESVVF